MKNILEVKSLSVELGVTHVIDNLSFSLSEGENLAVIGPNGSGKTVLLRALLGLLPHEGIIRWAPGVHLGYVPQKIDLERDIPVTAMNLLSAKAALAHMGEHDVRTVARSVGVSPAILDAPLRELSGGQFQRILIAFALLGNPNVILFDEPTASIDEAGEGQIYEMLHELQETRGITTIVVSHDLSFV